MRRPFPILGRLKTCLLLAAAAACVFGAGDQDTIHAGPVYTSLTVFPEVKVLVTVPPTAKPETLTPASFSLKVDNGPASPGTQVQTLADSGLGMAAVVMLDVSGSMTGGPLNAIRGGLVKFASEATLGDRVAICTLADETRWDVNWNDSPEQFKTALAGLKSRGSLTRLWDGLLEVVGRYPETPIARRLVVISDGHDEGSQHTLEEVLAAAAQQHVVVDSIGMTRSDPKYLANLERLSVTTGGVHRAALSLTMLEQLVGGGIKRYRTIPVVTFKVEGVTADGKPHVFGVTWKGGGAELQSQVEAPAPDDPKAVTPATVEPKVDAPVTPPPSTPAETGGSGFRQQLDRIPRLWLYIGAGVLAAAALGLIAFLAMRKRTPIASIKRPPPPVFQPPPTQPHQAPPVSYSPDPFQQPPPRPFNSTGAFGNDTPPRPSNAPAALQGSVFMALPPEPEPMPVPASIPASSFQPPTKLNPSAWLVCIEGPLAGQSFPIDVGEYWIGANANNNLVLADDATVSGNHGCIAFEADALGVYDHRSTNGMFLNDERLGDVRRALQPGDRLRVGRSIFILRPGSANRTT